MNRQASIVGEVQKPGKLSIEYSFTGEFPAILHSLNISLLASTYQAGQLVAIGTQQQELVVQFEEFDRPMGLAYSPRRLAVATRQQIWILNAHDSIASELVPPGRYQKAFVARQSRWTGDIQSHEMSWQGDRLMLVNTSFSCLCTLHDEFSFVPQWQPPFVSELAAEDRCHLNGVAMADGEPLFATAIGTTDSPGGWRSKKLDAGVLLTVPEGDIIAKGLCMPHSPRIHRGELWLLNSGRGQLVRVYPESGICEVVTTLPGYTRGLATWGKYAFIGLSKIRESAVFGGVPIADFPEALKCAVAVVDLATGRMVGHLEFMSGVEELFDVVVVPDTHAVAIAGPNPTPENPTIWVVPHPEIAFI